jgi:hypothetical protein
MCSLDALFDITGMFYPVYNSWENLIPGQIPPDVRNPGATGNNPRSIDAQWLLWAQYTNVFQNPDGTRGTHLPTTSLIFDPCVSNDAAMYKRTSSHLYHDPYNPLVAPYTDPYSTSPISPGYTAPSGEDATGSTYYPPSTSSNANSSSRTKVSPKSSWIKYDQNFQIIENTNNVFIPSISNCNPSSFLSNDPSMANKDYQGFSINEKSVPIDNSSYANHYVQTTGVPIYFIRMFGSAVRAGYPVPTPALRGLKRDPLVGPGTALPCYRTGNNNRWLCKQLDTSGVLPIFMGMWDILYAVIGDPTAQNIRFNSTTNAEFV